MRLPLLSQKNFQVFKNVSFDSKVIAYLFCYDTKHKVVFTVLFLAVFIFKESLFLAIGNTSKVVVFVFKGSLLAIGNIYIYI